MKKLLLLACLCLSLQGYSQHERLGKSVKELKATYPQCHRTEEVTGSMMTYQVDLESGLWVFGAAHNVVVSAIYHPPAKYLKHVVLWHDENFVRTGVNTWEVEMNGFTIYAKTLYIEGELMFKYELVKQ